MNYFLFSDAGVEHLDLLMATSEIGIWELDVASGTALRNLRHDRIFGYDELSDSWTVDSFLEHVFEADRARVKDLLTTALETGKPWSFQTQIRRADGIDRWISATGVPKFSDTGEVEKLIGHVIDITATKRNEERLKLLSRELNHRVANTFAIMNSMVRHAAKKTTSVEDFAARLTERLGALARANRVLVADEAERSSLHDLLDMELDAFANWRPRITVTGTTSVWFTGRASEALSMIFHELITNAVKYGALSVPGGQVAIDITVDADQQVHIAWRETGGPAVSENRTAGIGSSVLLNAMREEGQVDLDFAADGLKCDITVFESFQRDAQERPAKPAATLPVDRDPVDDSVFSGCNIMVIEDDPIIGMDVVDIFQSRGAVVAGPYRTVANALKAIRNRPDVAVVDVNLGRETSEAVAEQLSRRDIPFLVLSGQMDVSDLPAAFQDKPLLSKPFDEDRLVAHLAALIT